MKNTRFRVLFNGISTVVFLIFMYNSNFGEKWKLGSGVYGGGIHQIGGKHGRIITEIHGISSNVSKATLSDYKICSQIFKHEGYQNSCDYVLAHPECNSGGYFNYIKFIYCDCKKFSIFGYLILAIWLAVLFYLLGNTAADYFCCSLEKLSELLKMSPTVAGVTLLPFGNGAPDVFASIAAFMGRGSGDDVGINSVLGGAVFVTCVVVGVVSLFVADKRVQIDKTCFIRDLCFFLFSIACLTLILLIGEVGIWGAIAFVSIYVVYGLYVAVTEIINKKGRGSKLDGLTPLLPVVGSFFSSCNGEGEGDQSMYASLLSPDSHDNSPEVPSKLPHWIWNVNVAIYSDYTKSGVEDSSRPLWGWNDEGEMNVESPCSFSTLFSILEIPLSIPRRLTIPIVEEERWSKVYAIASAFLAPVLLAVLWNTQEEIVPMSGKIAYFIGVSAGCIFSVLAFLYTCPEHPPRRFLFPWVFGGFFMSIIWFYIVANELVALLVSLGTIFGVNPSILALTILAWGNSMGDLMSNTALAMNDRNGVQIAMSGSYAGPMFNTLIGLGISLVLAAWYKGSEPYVIQQDNGLFITVGFLAAGLIWALIVLPQSDMRPNRILGVGLIIIYGIFLSLQVSIAVVSGSQSI
ncbi:cation/calcium exchanger 4-like [Chenopodium quinoa]|uniref:Sodium/calcium exchanger membrane region domain-containing protein n=1 Tax=Chenopodium quinoa TaxID=63459 RepID=A0A803M8N2_CHEQI|nr:cation/calcium exchanger 4-like [Chenopodium quinoa]